MSAHALRAARVRDGHGVRAGGGAEAPGARHARRHVREYPVIVFKSNSRAKAPSISIKANILSSTTSAGFSKFHRI